MVVFATPERRETSSRLVPPSPNSVNSSYAAFNVASLTASLERRNGAFAFDRGIVFFPWSARLDLAASIATIPYRS